MAETVGICYDPRVRIWPNFIIVSLIVGCAGSLGSRLAPPGRNTLVRDQLVIHGDFALAAHHRLFEELTAERADLCRRLALPVSDEPIDVYLFESQERFAGFIKLHYPQFPDRRAFFVKTDTRLLVYAQWGDRMADDLRHEVTHGYLHSVVPNVPLWLDEGIAKYYEVSRGGQGLNRPLLDRLVERLDREHWRPDPRRLESFPSDYSMTQDDYAESWGWVHWMMHSRPECLDVLRGYLAELRRTGNGGAAFIASGGDLSTSRGCDDSAYSETGERPVVRCVAGVALAAVSLANPNTAGKPARYTLHPPIITPTVATSYKGGKRYSRIDWHVNIPHVPKYRSALA